MPRKKRWERGWGLAAAERVVKEGLGESRTALEQSTEREVGESMSFWVPSGARAQQRDWAWHVPEIQKSDVRGQSEEMGPEGSRSPLRDLRVYREAFGFDSFHSPPPPPGP